LSRHAASGGLDTATCGDTPIGPHGDAAADGVSARTFDCCSRSNAAAGAFDNAAIDVESAACRTAHRMKPFVGRQSQEAVQLAATWRGAKVTASKATTSDANAPLTTETPQAPAKDLTSLQASEACAAKALAGATCSKSTQTIAAESAGA
jgi:hypothetical protein